MSNKPPTVCVALQSRKDILQRSVLKNASLEESSRCRCHYCMCVCEARPELPYLDVVEVRMWNTTMRISYYQGPTKGKGRIRREFFVLSTQDDPIIPVSNCISGNTGSRQSFETIRSWLDTCLTTHKTLCSTLDANDSASKLPDRVIEVSQDGSRRIRLINTVNMIGRYACLSHCWGNQQPLQTTLIPDTISAHEQNINEEDMPKTFQDAIKVILEIGIQYLWIDSLCIIQDDEKDWQIQSAKMADIYANSTITIAASASSSPQGGLFHSANHKCRSRTLSSARNVHVREPLSHSTTGLPLLRRGWVFQERMLSPRVLHFAEDELIWECMECNDCECGVIDRLYGGWPTPKSKSHPARWRLLKNDQVKLLSAWSTLINEYSQLELSKPNDILPAISGIAKKFGEATGCTYVAGMWKETMPHSLLWYTYGPSRQRVPWRAPTFSWASTGSGRIDAPGLSYNIERLERMTTLVTVIGIKSFPIGDDPTGQLKSGYVILSGTLIQAIVRHRRPPGEIRYQIGTLPVDGEDEVRMGFFHDFDLKQPGYEVPDGETVFCLEMCCTGIVCRTPIYLVLVEKRSEPWESDGVRGEREFERIGLCWDLGRVYEADVRSLKESSPEYAIQHNAIVRII